MVNAHFGHALANRFAVAEIAIFRSVDARLNPRPRMPIFQAVKPRFKNVRCLDRVHGSIVSWFIHRSRRWGTHTALMENGALALDAPLPKNIEWIELSNRSRPTTAPAKRLIAKCRPREASAKCLVMLIREHKTGPQTGAGGFRRRPLSRAERTLCATASG